jgi:hypothetical protein
VTSAPVSTRGSGGSNAGDILVNVEAIVST